MITYKHAESCDYAIKLFNGINLFNQNLQVKLSQPIQTNPGSSAGLANNRSSSSNLNSLATIVNNYQNLNNSQHSHGHNINNNNRDINRSRQSLDTSNQIEQQQYQMQQQQQFQLMQNFQNNPFGPTSLMGSIPSLMNNNNNFQFNRSRSGPNLHDFDSPSDRNNRHHNSRRGANNFNGNNNHDRDNSRNYNNGGNPRDNSFNSHHNRHQRPRDYDDRHNSNTKSRSRSPLDGNNQTGSSNRRNRR